MIKTVFAHNQSLHGQALGIILKMDKKLELVGEVRNSNDLFSLVESKKPDIVLIDLTSFELDGLLITSKIAEQYPKVKTIVISDQNNEEYYYNAITAGAKGLVLKNSSIGELQKAINDVAKGGTWFSLELLHQVILGLGKKNRKKNSVKFAEREIEILELICDSLTNEEIAKRLNISGDTVKWHRANILSKTGVKNTAGLVIYAVKNNYIKI